MNEATQTDIDTSEREIVISRVFQAQRELVWKAWTDPELVVKWWGPRGFTTTIETMDFRVGGAWKHVMHGPDGANFPNKSIFKEIVPLERIVYSHGGGREVGGGPGASFVATWTFESEGEGTTRLTCRMVFPSKESRDTVVREYGAIEGGRQTLERLSEQIAAMQSEPFVFTREFDAPLDLVWRAWTEREGLMAWFGPKGFAMSDAKLELRPGGMFHYRLAGPNGAEMWGRFVYREIVPQERLVWVNSFSNPEGGVTRHPFSKELWPLHMLVVVTFAGNSGRTTVTVKSMAIDATGEERATFDRNHAGMNKGWAGTLEKLEACLPGARSD